MTMMPRRAVLLMLLAASASALVIPSRNVRVAHSSSRRRTTVVVAADAAPATQDELAPELEPELEPAPSTFVQCITSAQLAATKAFSAGNTLVEVEFPPLPTDMLEMAEVSAYDVSKANVDLAVNFAKRFAAKGKRVAILFPDEAEAERAIEEMGAAEPAPLVSLQPLVPRGDQNFGQQLFGIFGKLGAAREVKPVADADIYLALTFSAQELGDLETLHTLEPEKPIVLFNLKLEQLRGDLGLPAFPPKDLQYRFLSQFLPVYFLRTRTYSKSVAKPPFVVNYQGALFRCYPGPWQTLLDIGRGRYKRIETAKKRPNLGAFKVQLSEALQLGDEGKVNTFFRQGYKTSTWWEDDEDKEKSSNWRS